MKNQDFAVLCLRTPWPSEGKRLQDQKSSDQPAWTPHLLSTPHPSAFWLWSFPLVRTSPQMLSLQGCGVAPTIIASVWRVAIPKRLCALLPCGLCSNILRGLPWPQTLLCHFPVFFFFTAHYTQQRLVCWFAHQPPRWKLPTVGTWPVLFSQVPSSGNSTWHTVGPQELFLE